MLRAGIRIPTNCRIVPSGFGRITSYRRRNAMRLATRVLLCALVIFVLSVLAVGQTPRPDTDPRNLSPSVGTGGPEGGPTGLFTIYDGQTLRKGEFTFSVAYSRYARDPGDLTITDVPLSFNIGLSDHLELFFKLNAHRKVTADSPLNL